MSTLTINCATCTMPFEALRSDAKNCGSVCRSIARRDRDSRTLARVTGALRRLADAVGSVDDVLAAEATPHEYAEIAALVADARRATRDLA